MPRTRKSYPLEFRKKMVELVRAGRSPAELAREFEPTAQTIATWVAQADLDDGIRTDGLTTPEKEELKRLRKENKRLRMERKAPSQAVCKFGCNKIIRAYPPNN